MFDAGLHVHDDHLVPGQHDVHHQGLEQGAFRADAPGAPLFHAPKPHQLDAVHLRRQRIGQIVHFGIQLEVAADGSGLGFGTFENQLFHLGDGRNLVGTRYTQGRRKVGVRIGVDGQHMFSAVAEISDEKR